jgi:hypothetical protein
MDSSRILEFWQNPSEFLDSGEICGGLKSIDWRWSSDEVHLESRYIKYKHMSLSMFQVDSRWGKVKYTILGLQLQALQRSSQGSKKTQEILKNLDSTDNLFSGSNILDLIKNLQLTSDDSTVFFLFDGAQLYQSKKSDTWISI